MGPLDHVGIVSTTTTSVDQHVATLLAFLGTPTCGHLASFSRDVRTHTHHHHADRDTGKPISPQVAQLIKTLEFVELHEFLPTPLIWALATTLSTLCGCCSTHQHNQDKRPLNTVGDIFTCMMCFYRFVALAVVFHPEKFGQFMAHTNMILQTHLKFEGNGLRAYDCAFRLQVSGHPTEDWVSFNLSLYARLFTRQSHRHNSCRYCSAWEHTSSVCPWGVDIAQPISEPHSCHLRWGRPPFVFPGMLEHVAPPPHATSTTFAPQALLPTGPLCRYSPRPSSFIN